MPGARNGVTPREALEIIERQAPGAVLVFEGPHGAGKSWLLSQATRADDVVLRGRAAEADADLLAAAPLLGGGTDPSDLPGQLAAARSALGDDGRLVVDDAHHLDPATARLVGAIAARAGEWDVRVVVAARTGAAPGELQAAAQPLAPFTAADGPASFDHPVAVEDFAALVSATGGRPGLLAAAADDRLGTTVATLVASADAAAATVAQWLAWGGSAHDAELLDPRFEVADLDAALAEITELALIDADHAMAPGVAAAVRDATPPARRRELVSALVSADPFTLADWLLAAGDGSDLAREVFLAAARRDDAEPETAVDLFARADAIQALDAPDHGRLARALLLAGRPDDALVAARAAADRGEPAPDAVAVAAAAHARAERMADGAALLATLAAADPDHPHLALDAWYRAALGDSVDETSGERRLGSDAVAARFANAAAAWLEQGSEVALDDLAQAAQAAADLPDTPAWPQHPLATLATAASISRDGDMAAHATAQLVETERHADVATLRQRFVAMRAGRLSDAAGDPVAATAPRDQSLALALELGLALRQQVGDDLEAELERPRLLMTRIQPDLWATDVLCELALVSARIHSLADADRLLSHLDALIASPTSATGREVRWTRLIAAVMADDKDAVTAAIDDVLEATEPDGDVGAAMATAAEAFRSAFAGTAEPEEIFEATDRLKDIGLPFEASHLAAAAALRSTDEGATRELLARSRKLRGDRRRGTAPAGGDVDALSDREIDVARLVVQGRTHKEIGAELFISPKTVEHHVARIRRKLQAGNRAEMMAAITAYLDLVA